MKNSLTNAIALTGMALDHIQASAFGARPIVALILNDTIRQAAELRDRLNAIDDAIKAEPGDDCQHVDPAKELERIARKHLGFVTLESRNMDSLDFYECGVLAVRDALRAAYEAGAAR